MSLSKSSNLIGLILFWGWNLLSVFLCVFLLGMAVLPYVFMAAVNGEIPLSITLCLLILMVTPFCAILFAAKNPNKAVAFFFGVEIPIIILTLFRLFIVRELTLGSGFLLASALIAVAVFGWSLRDKSSAEGEKKRHLNPYIVTALSTLVLIAGLYVAILSGLYAFPMIIEFIKGLVSFKWTGSLEFFEPLILIIMLLFLTGMLAFFVFPIFIAYFYPKLWTQNGQTIRGHMSKAKYLIGSFCFALIWGGVFAMVSYQGQADYVSRLKDMSVAEKRAEMQTPKKVRKRLLNAYLNEYRYLGTKEESRNLISQYRRSTGSKELGQIAQDIQSALLKPLLYKGGRGDGVAAGKLYAQLLDSPIQRDEKKAITKALEATFNRDEVVAGLMNIGARNVILREQNIDIQTDAAISTVEIEEIYENLTYENQEIFYYFSLPEDAAITGLWIGRTDKREEMDAFIVAPRGAAQKVYEQQVRRNIDPALLEQVGPAQYRLRVFPIPVTRSRAQFNRGRNRGGEAGDRPFMRVHMRYIVPTGAGDSVLPTLLEKRNVDWSRKTERRMNGEKVGKTDSWMPSFLLPSQDMGNARRQVTLGENLVTFSPAPKNEPQPLGKLAVIVDSSYSLIGKQESLRAAIDDLNALQTAGLAKLDIFLSASQDATMTRSTSLNAQDIKPFGSLTAQSLINQFLGIASSEDYDAIILLTDQGLYGSESKIDKPLEAPLYFLHIDKAAAAYDDAVLDAIYRSGGGVATSVTSLKQQLTFNGPKARVIGDRLWTLKSSGLDVEIPVGSVQRSGLTALAARKIILMESFGKPPTLETLDKLHKLATTHDIVTPYSSMIVLVNERQKEALKKESEADDRFDREGRSGEEVLSSPNNPLVSGVPEPHEWLLIFVSLLMLIVIWRKRDEWDRVGGVR